MTLDELQAMSNEQLNELAAVQVMGLRWHTNFQMWVGDGISFDKWNPSEDMNDSWKLIATIQKLLYSKRRMFLTRLQACSSYGKVEDGLVIAWPDLLFQIKPRDITIAAILAKQEDKHGEN